MSSVTPVQRPEFHVEDTHLDENPTPDPVLLRTERRGASVVGCAGGGPARRGQCLPEQASKRHRGGTQLGSSLPGDSARGLDESCPSPISHLWRQPRDEGFRMTEQPPILLEQLPD